MKIYLIGFMGSGKTFLGRLLASKLKVAFYDLDGEIEKEQQMDINKIFKQKGEVYFRKKESEILLRSDINGVIATGGGIVESSINRKYLISDEHVVIWLNPEWSLILEHLKGSIKRPLYNDLSTEKILEIWEKRLELYKECADIVINDPNVDTLLRSINIYTKLNPQ